uniref:Uncharacterized protein n=1 Tax=Magallana gigas TaxID=29159 RepID=A0A8W8MUN4_MAGGI|nr:uncharacterized protein LOC117686655 [Crassostrea gigas]
MQRSNFTRCSETSCCKFVYITAPKDINITKIYLGSCSTRHATQLYTVYYNNNQSSQTLYEDRCCNGDIYVYYDYLPNAIPKTTQRTTRTGLRAVSSTPSWTPTSTGPPKAPIPPDPKITSVLVTIFVFSTLLITLGAAALLYRHYRKLKSATVKKLPDHYEYSVTQESRITETLDDSISPTTTNYFVLEVTERPRPPTTSPSSNTAPTPFSSSEYETVQLNNELEKPSECVYNTLREYSTVPDDVTDNYSRFADFNQEYCHLQR